MVGIDFGTSNTVVSVRTPDGVRLLPLDPASASIPTLLFVDQDRRVKIGHDARKAYGDAARRGGPTPGFRLFQALKIALKDPGIESTNVFGTQVRIERIVSWYLADLRQRIAAAVPDWDGRAIVGRPVELDPNPLVDTRLQGRFHSAFLEAGFEGVGFVHEPVSAAVDLVGRMEGRVLVFDFGGGTLDITVAEIRSGRISVLAGTGADLGGYLLDEDLARARVQKHFGHGGRLVTLAGQKLEVPHEVTGQVVRFKVLPFDEIRRIKRLIPELIVEAVEKDKLRGLLGFLERNLTYELYQAIDEAKIRLSSQACAEIAFAVEPHVAFREAVSRQDFDTLVAPRVAWAETLVLDALARAGLQPADIDHVVRVGGSSQVPVFVSLLERLFPGRLTAGNLFDGIALGLLPAWDRGLGLGPGPGFPSGSGLH